MLNIKQSFLLLFCIFLLLFIFSYRFTIEQNKNKDITNKTILKNYIGFIFIVFGILKLFNLIKFAKIFNKYDIISKKNKIYPFFYPFIEIIIGILLMENIKINEVLFFTIILMVISIFSVIPTLLSGEKLRCGCIGSFFNIPLSYITLSENIMMLSMSVNYLL